MDYSQQIYSKTESGASLTRDEALWLLVDAELPAIAEPASLLRQRLNPGRCVTFHVDTNPNYTNICDTDCKFCAFYRKPRNDDAYTLTVDEVMERIQKAVNLGARTVLLQGGHNPKIPLEYYLNLIRETRLRFPQVMPHFFSAPEIHAMTRYFKIPAEEILQQFWDAGQRTMPGGGAEILTERVRAEIAPRKTSTEEWLRIHEIAHGIGFKTTATMMYGHVETPDDIVDHLFALRTLQSRTGGLYAFIPWSFKPGNTKLSEKVKTTASGAQYLRVIGLARLVLDNVPHIQASWFSEGRKTGQLALEFGADDFGGTLIEENVLQQADFRNVTTTDEVVHIIHDAGYVPAERDTLYETIRVYDDEAYFQSRIAEPYNNSLSE
jgi:cyclic dehypoxanthinyl futalosine synthase